MFSSQNKCAQNKRKRGTPEEDVDDKHRKIGTRKLKKLKIHKELKHVVKMNLYETRVSKNKTLINTQNSQVNKTPSDYNNKKKISMTKIKLKKQNDRTDSVVKDTKEIDGTWRVNELCTKSDLQKEEINKKKEQFASKRQSVRKETFKLDSEVKQDSTKIFDLKELSRKLILQSISAIFHLTLEQLKNKNDLFTEDPQPIFMQVTCIRVPKVPRRQMRILLPHSIITSRDEVALFVCDLQKGRRKDYEPTVEYYKNLLDKCGCTRVNDIIPMNRVKTEFDQFELKRKLVNSYDYFLVDGRIAGHMSHLLGKEFFKKRKLPTSIKMQKKDLKQEINCALRKTNMKLHSNGDTHIVQIGNTLMNKKNVLENVLGACKYLSKNYPGGWANIHSLRLKGATSLSLPFYITLKNKNAIKPPMIQPKRPKAYHDVEGELSTFISDTKVIVKPEGDVILKKSGKHAEEMQVN